MKFYLLLFQSFPRFLQFLLHQFKSKISHYSISNYLIISKNPSQFTLFLLTFHHFSPINLCTIVQIIFLYPILSTLSQTFLPSYLPLFPIIMLFFVLFSPIRFNYLAIITLHTLQNTLIFTQTNILVYIPYNRIYLHILNPQFFSHIIASTWY